VVVTVSVGKKPWIVLDAIAYLEANVVPEWETFEWGCGGSTLWFAGLTKQVSSVETNPEWADAVMAAAVERAVWPLPIIHTVPVMWMDAQGVRYPATRVGWNEGDVPVPEWEDEYSGVIDRFYQDQKFGLIVIDGGVRHKCAERALKHMLPGGLMVLDNSGNADTLPATAILVAALGHGQRFVGPVYAESPEGECVVETGIWKMT